MEGRVIKDAVRRTLQEREKALTYLVDAIRKYRTLAEQPLTHQSFSAVRPRSSIFRGRRASDVEREIAIEKIQTE
jgi:hypothetical protein